MPISYFREMLADICESKIVTQNSDKGIRSNVYSLGVIRSFVCVKKQLLFLFPCIEVIPDWRVIKWSKSEYCSVFIANNILVALQW